MGNSPGFPEAQSPYPGVRRFSDKPASKNDNFDQRWQRFVESLDVTDEKMKLIEQLPNSKKLELVQNFELNTVKCSPAHCVESIRTARISQITASKRKQDHDDFRKVFSSAEISLRTNKIDWVLEFLENRGLEAIVSFMGESLKFLSRTDAFRSAHMNIDTNRRKASMTVEDFAPSSLARRDTPSPSKAKNMRGPSDRPPPTPNFSLSRNKSASPTLKSQSIPLSTSLTLETLKDCLHLCLKCFKTLLNNQDGCAKAFENSEVIEIITFCVLHPNYATKALALDLLSAICLIGGGHPRVLKAFGHFRRTIGESACFETIMNDFRVHEDLPLEQYNLEYSVACIQFINIVVHSPENINLRVYLQYSFTLLGLDDFLRALQARPGDKLNRHVDAYMNNMVNCSLLLDDAEAKEAAVEEVARLEAALEASESTAKQQAASFKQRDLALSELVESLRSKIRDINVAAGLQETANRRIQELEQSLAAAHHQIQLLQNAAETNSNAVVAAASETNSLGQVKPAPNPRQKKPTVCNMTTSTTLPMGFEFPDGDSTQLTGSPSDSRRKSMSLDVLTTTNQSTVSSSDSITRSSLSSSVSSGSDANYGTFSRKSGSITEKPRHGLISCTLISQVSDLCLARKTFANVSTNLSLLLSRLAAASYPKPPSPSPAVALPDWHTPAPLEAARLRRRQHRLRKPEVIGSTQCHQLAAILPDPWATCFASAHRTFKLSAQPVEDGDEAEVDSDAVRILQWLVDTRMVTSEALKKMETSEGEGPQLDDLPIIASLLSVNLNPFSATRLISLLEVIGSEERGRSDSALTTVFDVIEGLLKGIMSDRDISDTTVYCEGPQNWPLLQGFLRVNLLPFSLARNIQLLIELLSTLSACCNSIVTSTKLPTVMRVAEALVGSFLGKPDFLTLQVTNLSSLADWCLLVRRKSGEGDIADSTGGPKDSPCVPQRCSEGPVFSSVASHRRRPFMEALYKAVELTAPETLDWTHEIVHLDAASRILPSDIRDRIRELEYDLSLRDALFPLPEVPGHLQYLLPDAWANLGELKSILSEVETLIGAAAFQIYSTTGSKPVADAETIETFSDRDFSLELAALARFYASFKKWTIDAEKRTRNYAKASSCKVPSPSSAHRRNGHPRHQRACESASRSSRNGHDKHDSDRKRQNSRHLNTVGIMDNILAGLDSEPLYADIHKVLAKTQQNES